MDFLEEEFDEIIEIFQVESEEIISRLNNNLLDLEKNPNNKDAILVLFRDAHSLKGAARMIGFNNVQAIAHKVEDILGLAKDNRMHFNAQIVDILYKTVDFLSELIRKSIAKKQEIYSEKVAEQVAILENIKDYADDVEHNEVKIDVKFELLRNKQKAINDLISESLATLMEIEVARNENSIEKLLVIINELYDIFKQIGPYEIKKGFEDISVKLNFVSKASNILTYAEGEEIHKTLNTIISQLTAIYEINHFDVIDYYSLAFDKMTGKTNFQAEQAGSFENDELSEDINIEDPLGFKYTQENEKSQYSEEAQNISQTFDEESIEILETSFQETNQPESTENDLFFIQNKIRSLSQSDNSISEAKSFLTNYETTCSDETVKHILSTIIKILDFAEKNEQMLNEDSLSVIEQSIEYCENKIKNKIETADKELILQRLEIIQQLLRFNTDEKEDYLSTPEKKYTIKSKKITDFSTMFDSGEIKTLRVDSTKLDALINQVGELITTKIKTKKHLHELKKINKNFEEWQRTSNKTLTYLRYYDKKYFPQSGQVDSPLYQMVKQMLNLYSDYNKRFSDSISSISNLQRTILEDDAKTGMIIDDLESMVKNIRILPLATI